MSKIEVVDPQSHIWKVLGRLTSLDKDASAELLESLSNDDKVLLSKALSPRWNNYIPPEIKPHPKQLLFLTLPHREMLYGGSAGSGKLLCTLTIVPTPNGWSTVGDLHPGDTVFDQDGKPTKILAEYSPTPTKCYELTFSNGEKVKCCEDHLWSVYTARDRWKRLKNTVEWRENRKNNRKDFKVKDGSLRKRRYVRKECEFIPDPEYRVLSTREIVETLDDPSRKVFSPNYSLPPIGALELPDVELLIDPYVLGAWLGDGSSSSGQMTVWEKENFIIEEFIRAGFPAERSGGKNKVLINTTGLHTLLNKLNLINNKHIPTQYLRSSKTQRIALLQGLNDTDGTVDHKAGEVSFSTSNETLKNDYCELLSSLGIRHTVTSRIGKYKDQTGKVIECKRNYNINYLTDIPAFRLQRKLDLQKREGFRATHGLVYITGAEEIEPVPMKCFTVDSPHHTFLVGKTMIPTHNSLALLVGALQYADMPKYKALLVMKNYNNLREIIALSKEWLLNRKDCDYYTQEKIWRFQNGAELWFGNIDTEDDVYKYRSSSFQYIGYDEVTRLSFAQYSGLKTRARRTEEMKQMGIPIRIRAATNPGGSDDWTWVRDRFVDPEKRNPSTIFIPASWRDNPYLDQEEYQYQFEDLDPVERARLQDGDWFASSETSFIKSHWFNIKHNNLISPGDRRVRVWDIAATVASSTNRDPDFTAGALCSVKDGIFTIENIIYFRGTPLDNERKILSTYHNDTHVHGRQVETFIEMGNNSGSKVAIDQLLRGPFSGLNIRAITSNVPKTERARPFAVAAENGLVNIVSGDWVQQFFTECSVFGNGNKRAHDDGLDAVVHAYNKLVVLKSRRAYSQGFGGRQRSDKQMFSVLRPY